MSHTAAIPAKPPARRPRLRFTLRLLLAAITLLCLARGIWTHRARFAASLNESGELHTNQFFGSQPDIASNLAEQHWRNVATLVEWNRRATAVGVPELLVRAALPDFDKP